MRQHQHTYAGLLARFDGSLPAGRFHFDKIFGAPKPPKVEPLPKPPVTTDPAVSEAARLEREMARKRKGRASTLLTDSDALGDVPGTKATLLGG